MSLSKIANLAFITLLLFGFSFKANSANHVKNPYVIKNVFAYAREANPSASRIEATKQANRIAFSIMLTNLGINPDSKSNITDEEIAELVYSKKINEEKIAGKYYSAKFHIAFLKNAVSNILDQDSVTKTTELNAPAKIYLIFPVEMRNNRPFLWEKANLWYKNIEDFIQTNNIRNVILPKGDYEDISEVTLKNIKNNDFSQFAKIISKYGANKMIIAYYEIDNIENKSSITLKTLSIDESKKIRLNFVNSQNLNEKDLMKESAQRTINHITKLEKKRNLKIAYQPNEKIRINIAINNLEDWIFIHNRLRNMHFVRDLQLKAISKNIAKVILTSNGNYPDITKLFSQYNFILRQDDHGRYHLTTI